MLTVPSSALSRPAMMRSRVDLPPPEGPSRAVSWPVGRLTVTSSRATKSPNFLVTPVTSILMVSSGFRVSVALLGTQEGDHDDAGDAHEDQQEGRRVCRRLLEVLVLRLDHQGCGLGAAGDVARHDL